MEVLPCSWFGSSFEGACGYGAGWVAIGVGIAVSAIVFAYLAYWTLRSFQRNESGSQQISRELSTAWSISFVMAFVSPLLDLAELGSLVADPIRIFTFVFFFSTSIALAKHLKISPVIVLLALLPYVGILIVAAIFLPKMLAIGRDSAQPCIESSSARDANVMH